MDIDFLYVFFNISISLSNIIGCLNVYIFGKLGNGLHLS